MHIRTLPTHNGGSAISTTSVTARPQSRRAWHALRTRTLLCDLCREQLWHLGVRWSPHESEHRGSEILLSSPRNDDAHRLVRGNLYLRLGHTVSQIVSRDHDPLHIYMCVCGRKSDRGAPTIGACLTSHGARPMPRCATILSHYCAVTYEIFQASGVRSVVAI